MASSPGLLDQNWQFPSRPGTFGCLLQEAIGSAWFFWASNLEKTWRDTLDILVANVDRCKAAWIYIYIYMSDCENPRFTERTSRNLGRSHRLPHVCTIMIYGKLGGYRLQETAAFIYIYIYMWWTMNNMWYLGIANVDIREIWWHNLEKGYR